MVKKINAIAIVLFIAISTIFPQQLKVISFYPSYNQVINDTSNFKIKIIFNTKIDSNDLERKLYLYSNYSALKKYNYKIEDSTLFITPMGPYFQGEKISVMLTKYLNGLNGEYFSGFNWQFSFSLLIKNELNFNLKKTYHNFNGGYLSYVNLNDDQYPDLILTDWYNKGAVIFNKYGKNLMTWQVLPESPYGIIISDVDLDLKKEIHSKSLYFSLEQQENFYFLEDSSIHFGNKDINFDAFPDFIIRKTIDDTTQYISVQLNNGNGTYKEKEDTIVTDNNIILFKMADFNNDGINDIIYLTNVFPTNSGVSGENKIEILFLDQSLRIINIYVLKEEALPEGYYFGFFEKLNIADFNNDSFLDIQLLTSIGDYIFINNKNAGFFSDPDHIIFTGGGDTPHNAIPADINGDGWTDLLCSYTIFPEKFTKLYVLFNPADSNTTFWNNELIIDQKEPALINDILVSDFNCDRKIDICTLWDNGITIYFNNTPETIKEYNHKKPEYFRLYQNYPNPFNPNTIIRYALPKEEEVTVDVFDLRGRKVKTLFGGFQSAGYHTVRWDGTNEQGQAVTSGVYLYRIQAGGKTQSRKMLLLK